MRSSVEIAIQLHSEALIGQNSLPTIWPLIFGYFTVLLARQRVGVRVPPPPAIRKYRNLRRNGRFRPYISVLHHYPRVGQSSRTVQVKTKVLWCLGSPSARADRSLWAQFDRNYHIQTRVMTEKRNMPHISRLTVDNQSQLNLNSSPFEIPWESAPRTYRLDRADA